MRQERSDREDVDVGSCFDNLHRVAFSGAWAQVAPLVFDEPTIDILRHARPKVRLRLVLAPAV